MSGFLFFKVVPFSDCDPAGVAHFSRMAVWVEEAEHAYLKQAGFPIELRSPHALYWPRISFEAAYTAPARYGEEVKISLHPQRGKTSVTWEWSITHATKPVASGTMKTVCCQMINGKLVPHAVPTEI